jgi:hypothetical protein
MSRRKPIAVLVVVAALACWGAAAAVAAPAPATDDATGPTAATSIQQEANATVAFDDQTATATNVTVSNVTLPEGGYVAIHDSSLLEGEVVESVVGVSAYLEPGTHENVTVTLYGDVPGATFENESLQSSQVLVAMPHEETTGGETYDFVASNGSDDGPYVVDGEAVTDSATVVLVDDAGDGDNGADDENDEDEGSNENGADDESET